MTDQTPTSTDTPRIWAVIPCAGSGSRAGAAGPKQYQPLAGRAMVLHTLDAFAAVHRLAGVLVVVASGDTMLDPSSAMISVADCGGSTRAASVLNGLDRLVKQGAQPSDWVLVHDAARCLVTARQINRLIDACWDDPVGGLMALKLPDTLKREQRGRALETIDRSDKWLAQTPQMFRLGLLARALQVAGDTVTDESSAIERLGLAPKLVAGSAQNFKVTYPEDFALAEALLSARSRLSPGAESAQQSDRKARA
jgi:2-C-methyl-D-erythritol 4-phosphate cytidylyltransferase